jgi:tetratricopeptide (TPR) repeat protein
MMCPLCAAQVEVEATECPSCQAPLREYAAVYYHGDAMFNDALRRLKRGQPAEAAALAARVCGMRPRDVEALTLWAEACLARGDTEEAVRVLIDAIEVAPSPELEARYAEALEALEEATSPTTAVLADTAWRLQDALERLDQTLAQVSGAGG